MGEKNNNPSLRNKHIPLQLVNWFWKHNFLSERSKPAYDSLSRAVHHTHPHLHSTASYTHYMYTHMHPHSHCTHIYAWICTTLAAIVHVYGIHMEYAYLGFILIPVGAPPATNCFIISTYYVFTKQTTWVNTLYTFFKAFYNFENDTVQNLAISFIVWTKVS